MLAKETHRRYIHSSIFERLYQGDGGLSCKLVKRSSVGSKHAPGDVLGCQRACAEDNFTIFINGLEQMFSLIC
jgi:hypothetical protein